MGQVMRSILENDVIFLIPAYYKFTRCRIRGRESIQNWTKCCCMGQGSSGLKQTIVCVVKSTDGYLMYFAVAKSGIRSTYVAPNNQD